MWHAQSHNHHNHHNHSKAYSRLSHISAPFDIPTGTLLPMKGKYLSTMTFLRFTFACFPEGVSSFSPAFVRMLSRQSHFGSNRFASSVAQHQQQQQQQEGSDVWLHPDQFGEIPLPKSLSPSAVLEFKKCPQSFLLQYLYKLRQPQSVALAKGSMCHEALEKVFDLEPEDRNLETLQNLLRVSWGQNRFHDKYKFLFDTPDGERDIEAEKQWGQSALKLLENYYQVEDPSTITRPNPLRREIWLHSHLTLDPSLGITSQREMQGELNKKEDAETFYVRGIIDRLDMVRLPSKQVALKVVDYKTGKAPNLKYSRPVNERIVEEAFYQLKVYALMLREKGGGKQQPKGMDLRYLQLFYLNSENGGAKPWEYDLGETQEERDEVLNEVHQDLANVWTTITALVQQQDPKAFVGCDRSFCYCHKCRDRFVDGTLWEPN